MHTTRIKESRVSKAGLNYIQEEKEGEGDIGEAVEVYGIETSNK